MKITTINQIDRNDNNHYHFLKMDENGNGETINIKGDGTIPKHVHKVNKGVVFYSLNHIHKIEREL